VFFLQEKSHTQETLKGFLRRAQNEFGLRIKKIRSDNGTVTPQVSVSCYVGRLILISDAQ
jgi:hypothetical protein